MNREIKFRAWDETFKKMISWNDFLNTNMKNTFISQKSTGLTLMEFTGTIDKNGVEIYEGDIVKIGVDKAIVEYSNDYSGFILKPIGDYYFDSSMLAHNLEIIDKVIGNIYENPELLKESEE